MRSTKSGELAKGHRLDSRQRESSRNLLLSPNLSFSGPLKRRKCAKVRTIFELSGENAKIADWLVVG